jgi:hypothetical protein
MKRHLLFSSNYFFPYYVQWWPSTMEIRVPFSITKEVLQKESGRRLCSCSSVRIIYCCPIQLGGEFSNYIGFLPPYSYPLPLPSSLPFSLLILGGCQILTLEAPLITEKAPCMYNSYVYSKDDVRSPFVKPP